MSYNFTATVEGEFDEIAEGKEQWSDCIDSFYKLFHPLITTTLEERSDHKAGERVLGKDPKSGHTVSVKISRFGPVVQIGAADEVDKPQFAALQKGMSIATITLDEAIKLFDLPKDLGEFEEKTVSRDEVVSLAQKGLDYDRIRERWDAVKDDVPRTPAPQWALWSLSFKSRQKLQTTTQQK